MPICLSFCRCSTFQCDFSCSTLIETFRYAMMTEMFVFVLVFFFFQKNGLDKLLASHGHFNLLAPVNAALGSLQPRSRKVLIA